MNTTASPPDHHHPERAHDQVVFDAMRQFVVAPDRRYRIEKRGGCLHFFRTGSEFDTAWLARGARPLLGDRIAERLERSSRGALVLGGLGVSAVALALLVVCGIWAVTSAAPLRSSHVRGFGVLFLVFIVGLVMIIAGICSQRPNDDVEDEFRLALTDVADASLLPPQSELARRGEPQVARVHVQPRSGRPIRLGIPTESDLEAVKRIIPQLAA